MPWFPLIRQTQMLISCSNPDCDGQFSGEQAACPSCGTPVSHRIRNRAASTLPNRKAGMAVLLRNRSGQLACNNCGHTEFSRVKPSGGAAFANDYVCEKCRTRFSAPTPVWAAFLFMILGLPLTCLGAFWLYANLSSGNPVAIGIGGGIFFLGITSFWKGMQSVFPP